MHGVNNLCDMYTGNIPDRIETQNKHTKYNFHYHIKSEAQRFTPQRMLCRIVCRATILISLFHHLSWAEGIKQSRRHECRKYADILWEKSWKIWVAINFVLKVFKYHQTMCFQAHPFFLHHIIFTSITVHANHH